MFYVYSAKFVHIVSINYFNMTITKLVQDIITCILYLYMVNYFYIYIYLTDSSHLIKTSHHIVLNMIPK